VQHTDLALSSAGIFVSILVTFPNLPLKHILALAACNLFLFLLASFFLRRLQSAQSAMVGPVRTPKLASDLLPFPGGVGNDGKPMARYFSM
jgi:hypothetical protein